MTNADRIRKLSDEELMSMFQNICCPNSQWRTEEQESLLDSVIKTYKNIGYMEGYIAALKDLQKRGKGND